VGRIRNTHQSRADLIDIWTWIAARDEAVAIRVVDTITERCEQLADFPEMGPPRTEIAPDVRAPVTECWLVLYRIVAAGVQIVRIVDGARDLSIIELPENREP
jgi:toxin ParE1/3/4